MSDTPRRAPVKIGRDAVSSLKPWYHSFITAMNEFSMMPAEAKIIAVVNQKGGVGKTTTTVNLAYALSQLGKRVLAVDLDPQASLTIYSGLDLRALEQAQKTFYYSLVKDAPIEEIITSTEHYDVVPSSIRLSTGEAELVASPLAGPRLLARLLKPLRAHYDVILIDCPPTLTLLTVNALAAATYVLTPVKTDFISMMGLPLLQESINETRRRANPGLEVLGILPTIHSAHYSHDQDALEALKNAYEPEGIRVFEPIARSTGYDKAAAEYRSTLEVAPRTPGADNYYKLAEIIADGLSTTQ